jgi:hypothetical protein
MYMAHILHVGGLNANLEKFGIEPHYVMYRTDGETLQKAFEQLIEEKTKVKISLYLDADEETRALRVQFDDDEFEQLSDEDIEILGKYRLSYDEWYENANTLLSWLIDKDSALIAAECETNLVGHVETVDIYVTVEPTVYTAIYCMGGIITEVEHGNSLEKMIEKMQKKLAGNFDPEIDDARITDSYGHEVYSYSEEE